MARPKPRPRPHAAATERVYRMTVEYDGTRYSGFQIQDNARTIGGELHRALSGLLDRPIRLAGSGRTDAGVHALGQVVSFLGPSGLDPVRLRQELNEALPADINVLDAAPAPGDFHARHSAHARTYRYRVSTRRDAFRKRTVFWVKTRLDPDVLVAEAAAIVGHHDFASFTDATPDSTRVRVHAARWTRSDDLLLFDITAERFLYKMVRRLVGAMIESATGRSRRGLVAGLLHAPKAGATAAITAPPSGLFLVGADYAPREE